MGTAPRERSLAPLDLFARATAQRSSPPLQSHALGRLRHGDMKTAEAVQASWPLLHILHFGLCTSRGRIKWDPPQAGIGTAATLRITLPNPRLADTLTARNSVVVLDASGDQKVVAYLSSSQILTTECQSDGSTRP